MRICTKIRTMSRALKIVVGIILVGVMLAISPIGFLYLTFGYEEIAIKKAIDNQYVNRKFRGWDTIVSEEYGTFRCPKQWKLAEENDVCRLFDEDGNLWAVGTLYGTENDAYVNHLAFVEEILQQEVKTIDYVVNPKYTFMDGCYVGAFTIEAEKQLQLHYLLLTADRQKSFLLIVFENLDADKNAFDIAEAIAYSYAYS